MNQSGGCRITYGELNGWQTVVLESDLLRVTVLPDKGADIYELRHKPTDVDVLWKNEVGLLPPGVLPPEAERSPHAFLHNYEGVWQELFPNTGAPATVGDRTLPLHGEVALLPWTYTVECEDADEVAVRFVVRCVETPFRLERLMRLRRGEATLIVEGTATNEGNAPAQFVWGHHTVVGPPLLEAGARLDASARRLRTPPGAFPEILRLVPEQEGAWPFARGTDGTRIDLREIPGPDVRSTDDCFLLDLEDGWVSVANERIGLAFTLRWDAAIFGCIVAWQPYGGAQPAPLTGAYALGIEPWTYPGNLAAAQAAGQALELAPGASLTTTLRAELLHGR